MTETDLGSKPRATLATIPFNEVDKTLVADDHFLFLTLASASFVEILSEMYAGNLIQLFKEDKTLTKWLAECWQQEEVQHGTALKTYVQTVWPEFDWEKSFKAFYLQYSALCTIDQLEAHKSLELMARCVVETGTSSFYRALQHYVREPILRQILALIKADEVMHYNHFRQYFSKYHAIEQHSVPALIMAIWRRLGGIQSQDAYIAFKHVHQGFYPHRQFVPADWTNYSLTVKRLARDHYPFAMAIKMLLKPIPLVTPIRKMVEWPLVGIAMLFARA